MSDVHARNVTIINPPWLIPYVVRWRPTTSWSGRSRYSSRSVPVGHR